MGYSSEFIGKTFQAAQLTHDHRSLLQNFFLISAKLNFHRPLVCSTVCHVQYYTPEVGGSSVWQISKKYFAGVFYGQKSLMCWLCSLKRFPHKLTSGGGQLLTFNNKEGGLGWSNADVSKK